MKAEILSKLEQSIMIDPAIKEQIITQRNFLNQNQKNMIEKHITMGCDIQGNLYQKAIDNNPKFEQGLGLIINKHQTQTLAGMGSEHDQADILLVSL